MSLSAIRNIDHTVLLCRRLPETRAFYRDVMGFPVETFGRTLRVRMTRSEFAPGRKPRFGLPKTVAKVPFLCAN